MWVLGTLVPTHVQQASDSWCLPSVHAKEGAPFLLDLGGKESFEVVLRIISKAN